MTHRNPSYVEPEVDPPESNLGVSSIPGANGAREKANILDEILQFEAFEDLPDAEPQIVIEGILRIGEKLGITAGTKRFKTWLLLYIAYCVSNGIDFLDFKTTKSKVAFFDLELSRNGIKRRLARIKKAVGVGDFGDIRICSLRGKVSSFCNSFDQIKDRIKTEGFKVVIIDPVYKFLLGKEETSNGLVAQVLDRLTVFCMEAEVALIYVHHHSKGNQAAKDSLDRSSGAGAWSRDPDAVLDLSEHKESDHENRVFSAELTLRDFPPIDPFVVRWKFPLLQKDTEGLDPTELKQPNKTGGRPKNENIETILAVFRFCDSDGGTTVTKVSEATLIARRTIYRRVKELMPDKLVKAHLKNGYQLSLSERKRVEEFKTCNDEDEIPTQKH